MAEIFSNRSNWLLHPSKMKNGDILRIHPRDGLTVKMVIDALSAQKILYSKRGNADWIIVDHGTVILIQKKT